MKQSKLLLTISLVMIISILFTIIPAIGVSAAVGVINLSQYSGAVGTIIQISGAGYTPGSTYTLIFGTNNILAGTINTGGSFFYTLNVPPFPAGTYPITATTSAGDATTPANFTILPSISLSTISGQVGSQVTITGSGFAASVTVYIYLDDNPLTGIQTATNGAFSSSSIQIPETYAGSSHTFKVSDSLNTAYSTFTINPKLIANPTTLASGTNQLTISGTGFSASSSISITLDNTTINVSINTGTNGSFASTPINLPAVSAGSHTLRATDGGGRFDTVAITTASSITVSPQSGTVGSQITVTGTGFASGKSISITFNNTLVSVNPPPTVDNTGNFKATFTVPNLASGTYPVTASDGSGNASGKFTSSAAAGTGTPSAGVVGASIPIAGNGFAAGASVNIKFDNVSVSTAKADANGSFSTTLKLPASHSGTHTVVATDGTNSVSYSVSIMPSGTSDISSGVVGTTITITGDGFNASSSVNIKYDNTTIATVTSDFNGSFSSTIKIPASKAGAHALIATDGVNSVSLNVSVTPSAKIAGTSGNAGTDINISGTAFTPGATLAIQYDSDAVASTIIDSSGSFSATFQVPISKVGNHTITATDGVNTPTFNFQLTAAILAAPELTYPLRDAKADSPAKFQWNPLVSPNGAVTYNFQISQDVGFSSTVVDKTGLTSNTYQLTDLEKLKSVNKDKPYYWRVQAIDAAGDVSPWSNPSTFIVGYILPTWLIYFIYVVIAIVVFGVGFLVGRLSKRGYRT
ncbi:MAG TPA: IPT/TIG domain-containing protein [Dehalococcoidales bacterium]